MIDLIDALAARGVQSRVVLPEEGYVASVLRARAIPYVVYHYRPWAQQPALPAWDRFLKKPLVHVVRAVKLSRLIGRWRCHVIVTNTSTVCEGALAAKILRLPHITYAREFGDPSHGQNFEWGVRLSMRLLAMLSTRVVFNSAALARHHGRHVPPARARVIYNAVPVPAAFLAEGTPAETRKSDSTFSCVLVGYLNPGKGHEDAIRAIAELLGRGILVNLKLVGNAGPPDYMRRLRELIESLGVSEVVEIVGSVSEPWLSFRRADVALMCSRMEAFGRVTVEAMKLGTPVIGARSGGTLEVIHDRFNGLLYTPGDARELADKIEELARDRAAAARMGERARRFATETFSLERYGREFWDLLGEVTETGARGVGRRRLRVPALPPTMEKAIRAIRMSLGGWVAPRQAQILVVEDDPSISQWLADSLVAEGHEVDVAGNGRTALERLERSSYDLIVSDLRMPELDGVGLCRLLERERPREATKMLFLTGNTEAPEYRDFLAEKHDRTVAKPVDLSELNRLARQILAIQTE